MASKDARAIKWRHPELSTNPRSIDSGRLWESLRTKDRFRNPRTAAENSDVYLVELGGIELSPDSTYEKRVIFSGHSDIVTTSITTSIS